MQCSLGKLIVLVSQEVWALAWACVSLAIPQWLKSSIETSSIGGVCVAFCWGGVVLFGWFGNLGFCLGFFSTCTLHFVPARGKPTRDGWIFKPLCVSSREYFHVIPKPHKQTNCARMQILFRAKQGSFCNVISERSWKRLPQWPDFCLLTNIPYLSSISSFAYHYFVSLKITSRRSALTLKSDQSKFPVFWRSSRGKGWVSFCLVTVYFNLTVFSFCNPWALMFSEGLPVMIGFLDVTVTEKAKHSCLVPAILRSPAGPKSVKINWTLDILKPRTFSAKSFVHRQKVKADTGGNKFVSGVTPVASLALCSGFICCNLSSAEILVLGTGSTKIRKRGSAPQLLC